MQDNTNELKNLSKTFTETALACHREGNIEGAIEMYLNALYVQVQLYAVSARQYAGAIAETYTCLGYLRLQQERYDLCEEDYYKAKMYRMEQQMYEKEQFEIALLAVCYRNLAALYYRWGKYAAMREMAEKALSMYEELAEADPDEYEEDVVSMRLLCTLQ